MYVTNLVLNIATESLPKKYNTNSAGEDWSLNSNACCKRIVTTLSMVIGLRFTMFITIIISIYILTVVMIIFVAFHTFGEGSVEPNGSNLH